MTGRQFAAEHGDPAGWTTADYDTCWFCGTDDNPPNYTVCGFCNHHIADNPAA